MRLLHLFVELMNQHSKPAAARRLSSLIRVSQMSKTLVKYQIVRV